MKYLKIFEEYKERILIIVDVQKSFSEYFTENYLKELDKYCLSFNKVYQVFDNHHEGKNVDKDFLYDDDHNDINYEDLYNFNNQVDTIEKRYTYNVNVDFFKNILSEETYEKIKNKELKIGDNFRTLNNTVIVYIGNNHKWFHCPAKLFNLFEKVSSEEIIIVGGAENECILDIVITAKSLGLTIKENKKYIYSAKNCPIK